MKRLAGLLAAGILIASTVMTGQEIGEVEEGNRESGMEASNSTFSIEFNDSHVITGKVGEVVYVHAELVNNGFSTVPIDIIRSEERLPEAWATAICVDVCYATTVDSIRYVLQPGARQSFSFYFYMGPTPDTAHATVLFRNASSPEESYTEEVTGIATTISSAPAIQRDGGTLTGLYPNPFSDQVSVVGEDRISEVRIYNVSGELILSREVGEGEKSITTDPLLPGAYYYVLLEDGIVVDRGTCVKQ